MVSRLVRIRSRERMNSRSEGRNIAEVPSPVPVSNRTSIPPVVLPTLFSGMFKPLQSRVDAWISQFEEGYFHPLTNMARLSEEVGELAREVNHRFGQKTKKAGEADADLGMEMADILFVLICMANREGIDLQAAFDRMMEKVETRDRDRWKKKR